LISEKRPKKENGKPCAMEDPDSREGIKNDIRRSTAEDMGTTRL
jgi:hypothetical protein